LVQKIAQCGASQLELEAVVAVARHSGFRVAARELDMSSSALSHAVAALEAAFWAFVCSTGTTPQRRPVR